MGASSSCFGECGLTPVWVFCCLRTHDDSIGSLFPQPELQYLSSSAEVWPITTNSSTVEDCGTIRVDTMYILLPNRMHFRLRISKRNAAFSLVLLSSN